MTDWQCCNKQNAVCYGIGWLCCVAEKSEGRNCQKFIRGILAERNSAEK